MNHSEYVKIHRHMRKRIPKPKTCSDCKINHPVDLANISNMYKEVVSDWEWLCRSCHMKKDGRLKKLQNSVTPEVIKKSLRTRQQKYPKGEMQLKGWNTKKLNGFKPLRMKGKFIAKGDCHE